MSVQCSATADSKAPGCCIRGGDRIKCLGSERTAMRHCLLTCHAWCSDKLTAYTNAYTELHKFKPVPIAASRRENPRGLPY
ncbi:mCG1045251 [Mus musculus]|nr:mCG1045251 [Mus musculus]